MCEDDGAQRRLRPPFEDKPVERRVIDMLLRRTIQTSARRTPVTRNVCTSRRCKQQRTVKQNHRDRLPTAGPAPNTSESQARAASCTKKTSLFFGAHFKQHVFYVPAPLGNAFPGSQNQFCRFLPLPSVLLVFVLRTTCACSASRTASVTFWELASAIFTSKSDGHTQYADTPSSTSTVSCLRALVSRAANRKAMQNSLHHTFQTPSLAPRLHHSSEIAKRT